VFYINATSTPAPKNGIHVHSRALGGIHAHQAPTMRAWRAVIQWLRVFRSATLKPVDIASDTRSIIARSSGAVGFAGQDDLNWPQA